MKPWRLWAVVGRIAVVDNCDVVLCAYTCANWVGRQPEEVVRGCTCTVVVASGQCTRRGDVTGRTCRRSIHRHWPQRASSRGRIRDRYRGIALADREVAVGH